MNDILIVTYWSILNSCIVLLKNKMLNDITPDDLFVLQSITTVFLIFLFMIFYNYTPHYVKSYRKIMKDIKVHTWLWFLTIFFVLFSVVNNKMLSYKDVSYMVILSNIVYLVIITIASSYLENIPITRKKIGALILLCIAIYLLKS